MKILQINKFYYLKGGSERYFFNLCQILEKNGHQAIPFSMADSKNDYSEHSKYFINKVELNKFNLKNILKIFYNYDAVRRLKKLIKTEKPDMAHLHNIAHQISPAIINVLKKNNIPIVQTLHDYKLICPNYKLFNKGSVCKKCKGEKYYHCFTQKCVKNSYAKSFIGMCEAYWHKKILKAYDRVDLFIAPTQFVKDVCIEFGIPQEKIKVLNYFLTDDFFDISLCKESARAGQGDYLLYFGRLSEEKGIDVLLDALRQSKRGLKLKIAGLGSYRKNIEDLMACYNLSDKVEFLGAKYGDELKEVIQNARAIVVPSIWFEVLGYVLIESMAMGKVVIASRIGGMQEFISDGVNGFSFEPGNTADLRGKIDNLADYDLKEIGREARNMVLRLNAEEHYEKIAPIYKSLLA